MNRKLAYGLLTLPFILILVILGIMPAETRSTFFTEFGHRTRLMMGYEPEQYGDGEQGLRSEHPDEYGHDQVEEIVIADSDSDSDAGEEALSHSDDSGVSDSNSHASADDATTEADPSAAAKDSAID